MREGRGHHAFGDLPNVRNDERGKYGQARVGDGGELIRRGGGFGSEVALDIRGCIRLCHRDSVSADSGV